MMKNPTMFPDYQSLVMQHYEKKLNNNQLSSRLSHPTTAQLKAECVAKSANGFLRKDRRTLVDFFREDGDNKEILAEISNCYVDIFKPLLNYLNKKTTDTKPKNIELLAWLIDFEPRPYERGKKYIIDELKTGDTTPEEFEEAEDEADKEEPIGEIKKPEYNNTEAPPKGPTIVIVGEKDDTKERTSSVSMASSAIKQRAKPKAIIAALAIIVFILLGFVMYKKQGSTTVFGSTLSKEGGCMYWAGDHYQQIPCNQKINGTLVIALDTGMLNSFKKITQADTITNKDIGHVWYIKHNNIIEFYTASGNYPLNPTVRLKPITEHIISTYVIKKP